MCRTIEILAYRHGNNIISIDDTERRRYWARDVSSRNNRSKKGSIRETRRINYRGERVQTVIFGRRDSG